MFGAQRSLSGPSGGLTINTGSANAFGSTPNTQASQSGGLFGQAKPSSNLFGSPPATTQASQPPSLFGKPARTTQSGSLFGTTATTQGGGGLFGSSTTANTTAPQQQTGGLFGSLNASQPQQNKNMFGSLGTSQPQQQTGGLFGTTNTTQPQQQKLGGLFGLGAAQPSQPQPANSNSLFGGLGQTQTQQSASLFGKPQENKSLFGTNSNMGPPQQPQNPLFASSIGQYSRDQQTVPGVRVDLSNLRPTTRFNDLHEELQKVVVYVEEFVQNQIHFAEECESLLPKIETTIKSIPTDSEYCSRKLDTVQRVLENDAAAIDTAKRLVRNDAADARLSFRAIQNLRMPQQFHHVSPWNMPVASRNVGSDGGFEDGETSSGVSLVSYFSQQANAMSKSLQAYQNNLAEVEEYLKGVELSTMQEMANVQFTKGRDGSERSADDRYRELAAVFREFDNGILAVAGKVLAVRENVQDTILGEDLTSGRARR